VLDAHAFDSDRIGHRGEVRIFQVTSCIKEPSGLHLHFHEAQRPIVEHDDFDRQTCLNQCQKLTHHHGEAAVT